VSVKFPINLSLTVDEFAALRVLALLRYAELSERAERLASVMRAGDSLLEYEQLDLQTIRSVCAAVDFEWFAKGFS